MDETDRGRELRGLVMDEEITVLPGSYDALSARLVERMGFDCVFTSGFGLSATTLGLPDLGFMDMTLNLDRVRRIAGAVDVPLVADMDTGYGNPLNVRRTVLECVDAGVAGVILEDQEWPKKCGHMNQKRVVEAERHAERIRAAADARDDTDRDLVIIGRTDAREPLGMDEAVRRGGMYEDAGADVVFVEAPRSKEELERVANSFSAPSFANMIEGGKTPYLTYHELQDIGFDVVVYPLSTLFAASHAVERSLEALMEGGSTEGVDALSFEEFDEVIGAERYRELEKRYS